MMNSLRQNKPMPNNNPPAAIPAKHGEKMIEVRIRFWTDGIAPEKNTVVPKEAWDSGVVVMDGNGLHGITPKSPQPFNSILDLQVVLAKVLGENGVTLRA